MPVHAELPVAVAPADADDWVKDAVRDGGGRLVDVDDAEALIWAGGSADDLAGLLRGRDGITWVQLPSAGIERYTGLLHDGRLWTCAKGIYAQPVAEHALALMLAGMHHLPQFARATTWQRANYRDLEGACVTIVGGGGIAEALIGLLRPFHVEITVVRRHPAEMSGVARVLPAEQLAQALPNADAVVLALALTPDTTGVIGRGELERMRTTAWLVNVGRGALVDTDALVDALREGTIGGAALDVTDPEPLPDGHPLWSLDNCLITPHVANPPYVEHERYAELVCDNVRRRIAGEELRGKVDPELGY
jgi:phosphoglycerate dehydrogenase-like enzyme